VGAHLCFHLRVERNSLSKICGLFCLRDYGKVHKPRSVFIPLPCAECDNSLPFSGASSIPILYTFSCHPLPPTTPPFSLTLSCHLFLGLPLRIFYSKFIYNTLLEIQFSSILCACPNQRNLYNLIVSVMVGVFNNSINFLIS
jgi:hypothetical protein